MHSVSCNEQTHAPIDYRWCNILQPRDTKRSKTRHAIPKPIDDELNEFESAMGWQTIIGKRHTGSYAKCF